MLFLNIGVLGKNGNLVEVFEFDHLYLVIVKEDGDGFKEIIGFFDKKNLKEKYDKKSLKEHLIKSLTKEEIEELISSIRNEF